MIKNSFDSFGNKNINNNCIYFLNYIFNIEYNSDWENIFNFFNKEKNNKYLLFLENINSEIFNQILLYHFELYFNQILSNFDKYNYTHLKQALNYISNIFNNNVPNDLANIKKIFSIAYIKVFIDKISKKYLNNLSMNLDEFISLVNSDEINEDIKYIIKIYFFKCVYFNNKELDNINKLNSYIITKEHFPFKEDYIFQHKKIKKENFVFENCFIPMNNIDIYMQEKNKIKEKNFPELNYGFFIKEEFDIFYCLFINHIFSPIFSLNLSQYDEKKNLDNFITEFEQNILGKKIIISNNNKHFIQIFQNLYTKKIINKYQINSQNQLEILFYSIRFILSLFNNNNKNNNNFYSSLISQNTYEIITSSYVPGTTPFNNIYLNSYYALKELMPITNENEFGFYICSCGQYYTLGKCTCPAYQFNC